MGKRVLGNTLTTPEFRHVLRSGGLSVGGKYFTFATVRNPLDQAVSHYTRRKNNHRGQYAHPVNFDRNGG